MFRILAEALAFRSQLANIAGKTFGGNRDLYKTLGYQRVLSPTDFRSRFERNEVANRVVKAFPQATWRGGCEIVEDDDPEIETQFEREFADLDNRLKIWDTFRKADTLSGIGRYAVILITAPGEMDQPLVKASAEEIAALDVYSEDEAKILTFEIDRKNPRFGKPVFYNLQRRIQSANGSTGFGISARVHYSRIIHVADGTLDDKVYGEPRLQCVWNRLDDLEKLAGGGSEAFWRRADAGKQFDLDPTLTVGDPEKEKLKVQLEEYEHDFRRFLLTRGIKINDLGSDVAEFKANVDSIVGLIAAGTGIPQRVLMGSEQGKLAAKQDKVSWDNRVIDRQRDYAGPGIVRPFVDRMIELTALSKPALGYDVRWSSITTMDDEQRATISTKWVASQSVRRNELRERVMDLPPIDGPEGDEILGVGNSTGVQNGGDREESVFAQVRAAKKGVATWKQIHMAADRFSGSRPTYRERVLWRRARAAEQVQARTRAEESGAEGGTASSVVSDRSQRRLALAKSRIAAAGRHSGQREGCREEPAPATSSLGAEERSA